MVRTGTRLPSFCLNRVATRVRARSPQIEAKRVAGCHDAGKLLAGYGAGDDPAGNSTRPDGGGEAGKQAAAGGRRIVVVVDSGKESRSALHWALSRTVQVQDTVVLLGVTRPPKAAGEGGGRRGTVDPESYGPLQSMKNLCRARKPEVPVEMSLVGAKERGPAIVEAARKEGAALLVLGQRKRSLSWRIVMVWAGGGGGGGVVDYCIQNAGCMAVAVRRRSRAAGGYLITTKRHRDFWLLA